MTLLRDIGEFVSRWLEGVAATIVAAFGRFVSPRVVRIVEESDGRSFTLSGAEAGGGRRDRLVSADGGTQFGRRKAGTSSILHIPVSHRLAAIAAAFITVLHDAVPYSPSGTGGIMLRAGI